MKQSENYKNIAQTTLPPLDRIETQDTLPPPPQPQPVHKPNMTRKISTLQGITIGQKQTYSGTSEMQKPTLAN